MGLKDLSVEELKAIKERDEKKLQRQKTELVNENVAILISACNLAQEKGAFTLQEARHIMNAIDTLKENNKSYHC